MVGDAGADSSDDQKSLQISLLAQCMHVCICDHLNYRISAMLLIIWTTRHEARNH